MVRPTTTHVAALDGLRGVAVAAVVAYHLRPEWVPGGYLGVDLFFVLSGYLITSLLLAERERTGRVDLVAFAGRRFRRLLPAIVLVVVAVAGWAAIDGDVAEIERVRRHAWATLAYVANWVFIVDGDSYFAELAAPSPLRHVWSLAIEEQFYLVWPLTLFALGRAGGRRAVGVGAAVLAVASAVWMAVRFDGGDPSRVYFGTDTRIFEPLAGAVAAVVVPLGTARDRRWPAAGLVAGVAWVAAVLLVDDAWTGFYEGGAAALAAVGVVVVVAATVDGGSGPARVLRWRPLVAVGVISYGVYLWHWPLAVIARREGWTGAAADLGIVAVTLGLSTVSYLVVERPVRAGLRAGDRRWVPLVAGLAVVALAAGTVGLVTRTDRRPGTTVETVLAGLTAPAGPSTEDGSPADDAWSPGGEDGLDRSLTVVLIGDSTAWTLGGGGIYFSEDHGPYESPFDPDDIVLVNLARKGYRLVPGATTDLGGVREEPVENVEHERWWRETVRELRPDLVVALFGFTDLQSRIVAGEEVPFASPRFDTLLARSAADLLGDLARISPVVLLDAPSALPGELLGPDTEAFLAAHGVDRVEHLNRILGETAAGLPGVTTLAFGTWMCPTPDACVLDGDGRSLRTDGVHFTLDGARVAADWLAGPLREAVAESFDDAPVDGADGGEGA